MKRVYINIRKFYPAYQAVSLTVPVRRPYKQPNSFRRKKRPLTTYSEVFFHKFLECCSIWLTLDGEHRDAARSLDFFSENLKNLKTGSIE